MAGRNTFCSSVFAHQVVTVIRQKTSLRQISFYVPLFLWFSVGMDQSETKHSPVTHFPIIKTVVGSIAEFYRSYGYSYLDE